MSDVPPGKHAMVMRWRAHLEETLATLERTLGAARSRMDVVGERPTNRGERAEVTSQGYLADGLGRRIEEVRTALALLEEVNLAASDRIRAGSLVAVEEADGGMRWLLVLPGGDGTRVWDEDRAVSVVPPGSPWVRALRDRGVGDEVSIERATGPVTVRVTSVT
ncbi:MAG: hypothetical protein JXB39_09350 [Deltaproteobacteria bacterium]|nr:hypothetical protein [Deltaproteobacteria bacterium]